ncbi:MAG: ferredoxin [Actinomycetota bacterium]|nr:ferredoxin [Actinomycetota bacterium]
MTRRALRLRIDPVACDGYGYCAELLPELVELDEWGYPIVSDPVVPTALEALARRCATACPRNAVLLEAPAPPLPAGRPGAR